MISLALNMNGLWLLTRLTGFKSTAGEVSCDLAWLRNTTYYFKLMLKQPYTLTLSHGICKLQPCISLHSLHLYNPITSYFQLIHSQFGIEDLVHPQTY